MRPGLKSPRWIALASMMAVGEVLTVSSRALAQGQAASTVATARELFQRGLAALEAQRYADAVASFERSYDLRPSPVVQYNLALAYRGAGRHQDAIRTFERYLRAPSASASRDDLVEIAREIERLRSSLPTVFLDIRPRNASVSIDVVTDVPSIGSVRVDPGDHVVETSLDGFRHESRRISARPGSIHRMRFELDPVGEAPRLAIDPRTESAEVEIDGEIVGRGAVERIVSAGEHSIVVRAPGFVAERRTVRVGASGRTAVVLSLMRQEGVPPWVLGASIGGGVAVVTAIIVGVVVATTGGPVVPTGSPGWQGNFREVQ